MLDCGVVKCDLFYARQVILNKIIREMRVIHASLVNCKSLVQIKVKISSEAFRRSISRYILEDYIGGLYGKVLPEVFRTDRATKERGLCDENRRQYFPVQTEQTRLIRDLLYGFVGLQFVVTL